jgi:site-specific DNA-methyltransferase (adenine-specific)
MRNLSESEVLIRHQEEISILNKVQIEGQTYLNEIAYSQKPFGLRTYVKPMEKGNILLRYNGGIGPYDRDCITVNKNLIDNWKIVTSRLTAEHAGETDKNGQKRIFATLEMLEPGTICTETYMMLCTYKSKTECANVLKYLKTRFVRALIAMATSTQQMSKANFRFVPLQDFTKSWTDEELYKKYNLTDDEIKFIESMIKPME